ncbi:MAG: hypothetical protein ABR591_13525, partial [Candidatus Velthaea sp.]
AAPVSGAAPGGVPGENGDRKRRRRRRRRRGRGPQDGVAQAAQPAQTSVPDRHIFRVDSGGAAQATGETAPREPSRAIAPWARKTAHVAVEPPPPSIQAPDASPDVKVTRPARRRRSAGDGEPAAAAPLEAARLPVLPAPQPDDRAQRARRSRTAAADAEAATATETPRKRTPRAVAPAAAPAETPAPKRAAAKKAPAKKAPAKKAAGAKKATSVKKTAAKKAASTRKKK